MIEETPFTSHIPELDLADDFDMLQDFSREGQRHLLTARNCLLVLETVSTDMESVETIFKTFHTIAGLADFLKLHDIYWITKYAEDMTNLVRKKKLVFDGAVHDLSDQALKRLQLLFELLDEQIANRGKPPQKYPEQEELVSALKDAAQHSDNVKSPKLKDVYQQHPAPLIKADQEYDFYDHLKDKIHQASGNIVMRKEPLERLLDDFKKLSSELKQAQERVQDRQKDLIKERELALTLTQKAQDEAKVKSDYLANMSHEIRTLINAILGFTELIKGDLPKGSKQIDHLNTIIVSGRMLLDIVNNILDFSKVEAGKLKLETIPFNLRLIVEDVAKIVRARIDDKPVTLYIDIEPDVPLSLVGDPTRLKQVFMNLLDNAVKFTDRGQIGVSVTLSRQQGKLNRPALHFRVKDSGIGIPEDRKNLIFDSFTQADASTTRLYGGTGLGLALCRAFVEAMNGSIWVDSEPGAGTEFNFVIQFQKAEQEISIDVPEFSRVEKVLVVTPSEKTSKMFQYIFDQLSMTPLSICRNIKHAREILSSLNKPPDIIFLDALFDGDDPKAFATDIKGQKQFNASKLVAVCCDIKFLDRDSQHGELFDGVVLTPVILTEFVSAVNKLFPDEVKSDEDFRPFEKIQFPGLKILVVEDSIPNQELLRVYLEDLGCLSDFASNGQEAVELLKRGVYHLCFMDLQMPVLGGFEATQIIRNELKLELPIVALTAAEVKEEKEKCLKGGMTDYLSKPFDVEKLIEKIRSLTNNGVT